MAPQQIRNTGCISNVTDSKLHHEKKSSLDFLLNKSFSVQLHSACMPCTLARPHLVVWLKLFLGPPLTWANSRAQMCRPAWFIAVHIFDSGSFSMMWLIVLVDQALCCGCNTIQCMLFSYYDFVLLVVFSGKVLGKEPWQLQPSSQSIFRFVIIPNNRDMNQWTFIDHEVA